MVRVLNDNQTEFLIRGNHDLMLLGADSDEGDCLLLVDLLDLGLRLVQEPTDDLTIIDRINLVHGCADGKTFLVDDNETDNAFVRINAVKRCFNLCRHL